VNHFATPEFRFHYRRLTDEAREPADRCFAMLEADPRHPSLRLKTVGDFWSARVGLRIREPTRVEASSMSARIRRRSSSSSTLSCRALPRDMTW
jgi:hypothetical protein